MKFTTSHEYVNATGEEALIGLTSFAVAELNELIFFELPEEGEEVTKGEPFGTVEAVKAVFDLNCPVAGEVIAVNQTAVDDAQKIAADPEGEGWLIKVKLSDPSDLDALMDEAAYKAHCESESH